MARKATTNAETGIYSAEGWSRNTTNNEVVRDSTVAHAGSFSWLVAGDGVAKNSWLPISITTGDWMIVRFYFRIAAFPASDLAIHPFMSAGASNNFNFVITSGGQLKITASNLVAESRLSAALTAGAWHKLEFAGRSAAASANYLSITARLDGVEFARYTQRFITGTAIGRALMATATAGYATAQRTNIDDVIVNDSTTGSDNYWPDDTKPLSRSGLGYTPATVRSTATVASGSSTSPTVNAPGTIATGDLLIAAIHLGLTATITPPTGWSLVVTGGSGSSILKVYMKTATGSEPGSYTFTASTSVTYISAAWALSGVDMSDPILDASAMQQSTASSTYIAPQLDLEVGDALTLELIAARQGASSPTFSDAFARPTDGLVNTTDGTRFQIIKGGWYAQSDGGLIGGDTITGGASGYFGSAVHVALRPASPLQDIDAGGVASTGVAGGIVSLTTGTAGTVSAGGKASTVAAGGAELTALAPTAPTEITPGGLAPTSVAGGATVATAPGGLAVGGVAPNSDIVGGSDVGVVGSVVIGGELEPRVPGDFYDRWASGVHVGVTQPTQRVMLRTGRFWRRNANWFGPEMDVHIFGAPARPWQAFWTPEAPAAEYREVPNVREVRLEQSLEQNGVTSATITIENIYYRPEEAGHHSIKRGYMAPLRGYVGGEQTAIVDEQGETLAENEWFGLLGRESQVTVYQGYGDSEVKAFTGLIDDVDTSSRPDVITITARDFGKVLTDERIFGWNKEPLVKDPVIFIDNDQADDITRVGSNGDSSSERTGHEADKALDDDGDTAWWSDWHTDPDVTEWVQIRLTEGRYSDYYLNLGQTHGDVYVSLFAKELADGSAPTMNGEDITADAWQGSGSVPGGFGGIPYIVHVSGASAGGTTRSLSDVYRVGDDSILRISLRDLPLMAIDPGRFGATVVALKGRKRLLSEEAREQKWVRVGDASDVVRQILRWAGFKEFEVDDAGTSLSKRFVANRGMTYMDVIQRMKDLLGFTFFISDPTNSDSSLGVPVFRRSLIVTDADPVLTIDDNSLLNAIEVKQSDESLAYIIRVRGRDSSNGQALGGDSERRIMFTFRPPWSYQLGSGIIDRLGGVIKHVIYTDKMFKTADDIKFAAYHIALQEALASIQASAQIPGNPGPQVDDHVALLDLGTGVTSRLSIQSRSSTFTRSADQTSWALTLGGALVDEPDVSDMVAIIEAARRS